MAAERAPDVRHEVARSGDPTLVIDGRYVHSRHDPRREAVRRIEPIARREPACIVFLGLGLGYLPAEALARTELSRVVIYEPDATVRAAARSGPCGDALREALDSTDLPEQPSTESATVGRATLARSVSDLDHLMLAHCVNGFETVVLHGRFDSQPNELESALAAEQAFRRRLDINRNTLERFGRLWVRNLCRNLPLLGQGVGVEALAGAFAGVPGLLLAAGPTLDQSLSYLRELKHRTLVVAVDTALAPCLRAGVVPDLAVVVDPQYWNARHLDRLDLTGTILVSETSAHPSVFRRFAPPYFFCSSVFPLGQSYEAVLGRFGSLGAGGSVATTAWDLMRLLGCSRIVTSGLDLGFPGGVTHCRDSFFESLAVATGTRVIPGEGVVFRYVWGAEPKPVPDNAGGYLLSDRRMEIYRSWFELQIDRTSLSTVSVTRGSARIRGISLVEADEVLAYPSIRPGIDQTLSRIRTLHADEHARRRLISTQTDEIRGQLDTLERLAVRAERAVDELQRRFDAGLVVDFDLLREHDTAIAANPSGRIAGFLMQEAINAIGAGYGSESIADQLAASRTLYATLHEAAAYHATQLHRVTLEGFSSSLRAAEPKR